MKEIALLCPAILIGFVIGLFAENHKFHRAEYFINTCVGNNLNHSEADRNERCQQAFKLFTDKE